MVRTAPAQDLEQASGQVVEAELVAVRAVPEVVGTEAEAEAEAEGSTAAAGSTAAGSTAEAARAVPVVMSSALAALRRESTAPMASLAVLAVDKDLPPPSCTNNPMRKQDSDRDTQRDISARLGQHSNPDGIPQWVCGPRPGVCFLVRRACTDRVRLCSSSCRNLSGTACHLFYNLCGSQEVGQRHHGHHDHRPCRGKCRSISGNQHGTAHPNSS